MIILLVDDDAICNMISEKTLLRMGIANEIHVALNGAEAINLFNEYFHESHAIPDIILLDLNMPIMDGFSFIEAFKNLSLPNKERIKIIIVTSSADPNDIEKAKHMGIVHYLTKPISEDKLKLVLQ